MFSVVDLVDKFREFNQVNMGVSIDATGDRLHLIRWPSKWEQIKENFVEMKSLMPMQPHIILSYSILNAIHLQEDLEMMRSELTEDIQLNMVHEPDFFQARHLPEDIKKELIQWMKDDPFAAPLIPELKAEGDPAKLSELKEFLKRLDSFRNTDSTLIIPFL